MENIALVRRYLGGRKVIGSPKSELDFVEIIRKGFSYDAFTSLRDRAKFSDETMYGTMRIPKRTAARRKSRAARFKPAESEILLRLVRVLAAGSDVFGDTERSRKWLLGENRALGGVAPIKLLDTGMGFQKVMDVLNRIEYGVYS